MPGPAKKRGPSDEQKDAMEKRFYRTRRKEDPSAKRLGTYQSSPAKPAKKSITARAKGAVKTAAKTYVGLHTALPKAALRGGKAVAGSEAAKSVGRGFMQRLKSSPYGAVGKAVGRGAKKLATSSGRITPTPRPRKIPGLEHPLYRKEIHGKLKPETMPYRKGSFSRDDIIELKASPRRRRS